MNRIAMVALAVTVAAVMPLSAQYGDTMNGMGGTSGGAAAVGSKSSIGIWGGYTTVNMSDVNDALNATAGRRGSATEMNSGYIAAADYLYEVYPRLMLGPRIEYVGVNQGKATLLGGEIKEDLYLVPIMVGGRYYFMDRTTPWNISAGAFLGVGLGYGKTSLSSVNTTYSGTGFAGNLLVGGEYRLSSAVSLGLDFGYRIANISSMSTDTTSSGGGGGGGGGGYAPAIKKATVTNASGNTIAYDFSGMIANIGLMFKF